MKDYMPTNNMFDTNIKQSKSGCLCVGWNFNFLKMLIDFFLKRKENKMQTHLKAESFRPDFPQTDPITEQGLNANNLLRKCFQQTLVQK